MKKVAAIVFAVVIAAAVWAVALNYIFGGRGDAGGDEEGSRTGGLFARLTRDTGTDPLFDSRTGARTGPRIVAMPEFTGTPSVPQDFVIGATGAATSYLLENRGVKSIVDYNRIKNLQEQLRFEVSDWSNPAKYAEIGKALNVDTIAVGTIAEGGTTLFIGQEYVVSLQLIDIATLAVVGAYTHSGVAKGYLVLLKDGIKGMRISE